MIDPARAGLISRCMPKPSNRDCLLRAGLRVVHEQGFGAASVRDVVHAAGVPQGSFTNHWRSKEAFGLDVLDAYAAGVLQLMQSTLGDGMRPATERMRAYVTALKAECLGRGVRCGCMLGNMSAEAGGAGDAIRLRVLEIFDAMRARIATCLRDAVREGALPPDTDCPALAGIILSTLQGAILVAKAQHSAEPIDQVEQFLFARILPIRSPEEAEFWPSQPLGPVPDRHACGVRRT